ncbi:PIN-like domain-containing protein [Streptomyces sp. NPDC003395]
MPEADNHSPAGRGIFDCDDAYRTPTRADYERVLKSGMVVLDTNVLLNLYRSNQRTRQDTLAVLRRISGQLWIPHQVLTEFWRNRDLPSVRGHHHTKARDVISALDKVSRSTSDALGRWAKDVHLTNDDDVRQRIDSAKHSLVAALDQLKAIVTEQAKRDALEGTISTHTDPVLTELEPLLQGRIGNPLTMEELENAKQEAQRRAIEKIPPGYADFESKPPEQAAGDYILWVQTLAEAAARKCDVLLITGDIKEDWWIPGDNHLPARPRTELALELRNSSRGSFFMMTPSQLLATADEIFGLKVDERSVNELATTERKPFNGRPSKTILAAFLNRLVRAHANAYEATRTAMPNTDFKQIYGSVVTSFAREEICDEVIRQGGTIVRIAGVEYPVLNGQLIITHRYGNRSMSASDTRNRVRSSRRLSFIFRSCAEYFDGNFPPHIEPQDQVGISDVQRVALVFFASNTEEGVQAAEWGEVGLRPDGDFTLGYTLPLPLIKST